MKTFTQFIVLALMLFVFIVLVAIDIGGQPTVDLTDNQRDCLSKSGEYHLNINSDGEVDYETCDITADIKYN